MNSIILYYSYNGHTKKVAQKLARTQGAELVEIQTRKRKNIVGTFLLDCPRAMLRKPVPIQTVTQDLNEYDFITVAAPIWAGKPAPAFNAMVALLPKGKNVQVILVSGGGESKKSEEGTRHLLKQHGCKVLAYKDIKQSS